MAPAKSKSADDDETRCTAGRRLFRGIGGRGRAVISEGSAFPPGRPSICRSAFLPSFLPSFSVPRAHRSRYNSWGICCRHKFVGRAETATTAAAAAVAVSADTKARATSLMPILPSSLLWLYPLSLALTHFTSPSSSPSSLAGFSHPKVQFAMFVVMCFLSIRVS